MSAANARRSGRIDRGRDGGAPGATRAGEQIARRGSGVGVCDTLCLSKLSYFADWLVKGGSL